jgi:hypothetical protein
MTISKETADTIKETITSIEKRILNCQCIISEDELEIAKYRLEIEMQNKTIKDYEEILTLSGWM